MLTAGAAEAVERVAGDVIAALHRDLLDGVGHVLDGDAEEAFGDSSGVLASPIFRPALELLTHDIGVQRLVLPSGRRSPERSGFSLPSITLASVTVSGRRGDSRPGRGWRRPNPDRPGSGRPRSAGSSRRRPPPCGCASSARACARRRLRSRRRARRRRIVADIGRGAAHVEADELVEARPFAVSTMPTTPPAGPDRMASLPWNRSASVSPPDDCMNISRQPGAFAPVRSDLVT
jgi:hypothetical protein